MYLYWVQLSSTQDPPDALALFAQLYDIYFFFFFKQIYNKGRHADPKTKYTVIINLNCKTAVSWK